jgi:DNA repair protein RecN (Recombination protein N)
MLKRISIKNFAVIDEQTLELAEGLNVLTGETGAGKSILIEAFGFLLGARGSVSWLRTGASKLEVVGAFDDGLEIRRELDASGKTRAMINGKTEPLSALAALGERLVDFHGQHEHQTLLKPSVQLDLLDRFGGLDKDAASVAAAFAAWDALRRESDAAQMSEDERRRRIELLRYQVQELSEANLSAGEEEELETSLPLLKNAERLRTFADQTYELLYEQEGSINGQLLKAERALAELSRLDAGMKDTHDCLEAARLGLDEVAHRLSAYRDKVEVNPGKLDAILNRLEQLSRLKKKYGPTIEDAIASRDSLAVELSGLENSDLRKDRLAAELAAAETKLASACEKLHALRLKAAKKLETSLLKELKVLGMPSAAFSVAVEMEDGRFTKTGCDAVEFMLAPNPGEPLKPVKAIASGGELSRVMLALKTVFAQADRVPILVFDEVDAGIGGAVARAVGQKLSALGRTHQVLCVTHLAQVACFGKAHFGVIKETSSGRTRVNVERLAGDKRLEAIALMLGGRQATAASRKHAQELLEESLK